MELLFIRRKIWLDDFCDFEDELPRDVTAHHIEYAKVYKQDSKSSGLVDTKSIGDHALSVGYNNALCLPAKIVYITPMIMMMEYLVWRKVKEDSTWACSAWTMGAFNLIIPASQCLNSLYQYGLILTSVGVFFLVTYDF